MAAQKMFDGFNAKDLPHYDVIAIQELGPNAKQLISRRNDKTKNWNEQDWNILIDERNKILQSMEQCLEQKIQPTAPTMQGLIKKWFELTIKSFYEPNQDEFLAICELNCKHPEFRKSFDFYHPSLAVYTLEAARYFAEHYF